MKKLFLFVFTIFSVVSCSLDTDDHSSERAQMIGKEMLESDILYRITGSNTAVIEYCTNAFSSDTLMIYDNVSFNNLPFNITSIDSKAFKDNHTIKTIIMSTSLTNIGDEAFSGCDSLETLFYGYSVQKSDTIGERAFADCSKLKNITLSNSYVKKNAFKDCSALKNVIGHELSRIDEGAFSGCNNIKLFIILDRTPLAIDATVFSDSIASAKLIVPNGCREAYLSAPVWKKFGTITELNSEH
jgi:hypothetical protein